MKKTMFKVFASCIVVVCLTSSVSSRVTPPVLESIAVTIDENPIIEEHLNKQHEQHENLVGLNAVDLKPYDFKLIANEELWKLAITADKPMVSPRFYRQRRTFDPELEERLRKEIEDDNRTLTIPFKLNDTVPVIPPNSNDLEKSQEQEKEHSYELPEPQDSSENDNPQESNKSTGPQESNESTGPQKSNESTGPQESNESTGPQESNESTGPQKSNESTGPQESNESTGPQESNESTGPQKSNESTGPQEFNESTGPQESNESTGPQESNESTGPQESNESSGPQEFNEPGDPQGSYESNDVEESEENTDDSSSLDNDDNNTNRLGPSPPLLKTQF
ncbi:opioid growth factor receptor-like [Rhopalosiphum padi]|uniref:opioid growth factor receptor-like n=1 Tax=Rhopalosiphum padi TaxID=40932 RepID=UPI00298D98F1|nr:opioid growth factor receptor-like [Rhopalosiphum padi]